ARRIVITRRCHRENLRNGKRARPAAFEFSGENLQTEVKKEDSVTNVENTGGSAAGYGDAQNRVRNVNQGQARPGQARTVKCYNCNGTGHIARNCTQPKRPQNSEYYKDKMLLMQAQENRVALDVEQFLFLANGHDNAFDDDVDEQPVHDLALNMDNVFQADDYNAFDSDMDEAPTAQTMFMDNLSSVDPVINEAGPSYDSDILSEVPDHKLYQDVACAHHEGHVTYDSVQLDHVINSHVDYTIDSNMILYDQYVKDNEVPVVHSDASFVPTDAFMMIYNDMCKSHNQSVSNPSRNTVVKNSLTVELATYKEHVELYEQRAKFELTKREQKINKQLRLVISDRNFKEETLKRELHSIKLQLASTINHNKSIVEEVSFLKKDFKQKENKYLEDFLDMKSLKEKVEDKLIKQDQSLQTVNMLCRPRPHYNELNKPALYNGHEIIKDNHTPAIVHNAEDTLEIAKITRKKMNAKMNDPKLFSMATNSELNVARITEMHVANTSVEAHFLALEAELANLRDKSHHENQEELINHFSKLETTDSQITKLTDQVTNLQAQNDLFRAENDKIKQHYKEVYDSIKITRAKHIEQVTNLTTENVNLKSSVRVNSCPNAGGSQPKSHVKPNRISLAKSVNKLPIEDQPRKNKSHHITSNRVDSSSRLKRTVVQIVHWYLDSGCSKHMTEDRSRLMNFVKKFIETVRFGNDHFGAIMGYGDYVIDGVELIKGSRGHNLYTILIEDIMKSSPICLLSKASKNKSWLWHRRLNHLIFGTINDLARKDLVRGLPRLKFKKDHLCSACHLGKSKKHTYKPKAENTNLEVLNTLHMDLCGPMRVQTINGKKYILVIVDDYSRFTWVKFFRSKDENPDVVIKFITQIQIGLNKIVRYVRIDNGTEFVNHTMTEYYERIDTSALIMAQNSSIIL
nr:hypothetical protein [Tanacetum cinerariifolium]